MHDVPKEVSEQVIQQSHIIDTLETRRTDALRTVRSDRSLLDGARHALRHGSPEVAEEYLDRVIASLTGLEARLADAAGL